MTARVLAGLVVLTCGLPGLAEAAGPKYRFVSTTTLLVTATSTCTPSNEGGRRTTERFTYEIRSREVGTSEVGTGNQDPKGSTRRTGTIRRETAREYEGSEPMPPLSGTDPLQETERRYGILRRLASGRLELGLSNLGLLDPRFAPLDRGASVTIRQDPPPEVITVTSDDGRCVDEDRSDISRRTKITRVR